MLNGDVLGLAVANKLISRSTIPPTPDMVTNIQGFWKDVCNEHVKHIQENAEVPKGITVATAGTAAAQTGSTTEAGTVV